MFKWSQACFVLPLVWSSHARAEEAQYRSATEAQAASAVWGSSSVAAPAEEAAPGQSTAELVDAMPSTQVRRPGNASAGPTLGVRGADSNQTQVFLDGIPLGSAYDTSVQLDLIPPAFLGRLAIYRGLVPLELGRPLPGGVVELELDRRGPGGWSGTAGVGSWRDLSLLNAGRFRGERGELLLGVAIASSRGDFPYLDEQGTLFDSADDVPDQRRVNNDARSVQALARGAWRRGRLSGSTLGLVTARAFGMAGGTWPPQRAVRGTRTAASFAQRLDLTLDETTLWARGTLSFLSVVVRDPQQEIAAVATTRSEVHDLTPALTVGVRTSTPADGTLAALVSVDWESQGAGGPRTERWGGDLGAEWRGELWDGRARLATSWRTTLLAASSADDSTLAWQHAPQLGVALDLLAGSVRLEPYATTSWVERAPSFLELFGDYTTIRGNPDLSAERRLQGELGLRLGARSDDLSFDADVAAWARRVSDLIVLESSAAGTARAVNLSAARLAGADLSAGVAWRDQLGARLDGSWMDARERTGGDAGERLPFRPSLSASGTLWAAWKGLRLDYRLWHQSAFFADRGNTAALPARLSHDLAVAGRRTFGARRAWTVELGAAVENLADARVAQVEVRNGGQRVTVERPISDFVALPVPGRNWHVELGVQWTPGGSS